MSLQPQDKARIAVVVAALALAFLGGRYLRAPQVQIKDVVRTVTDTKSAERLAVALAELEHVTKELATWQARASSAESHVNTVVKWKFLPSGKLAEVTKETTKDAKQEASSQGGTHKTTDATKSLDMKLHRDVVIQEHQVAIETHTSTPVLPRWSVSLMPGAQLFGSKAITLYGPLVLGASVEYRFIGPISLGAWASTSGAAGITLRSEF